MNTVNIDQIDINNRQFCLSYPVHDKRLLQSIKHVGIIQPVTLLEMSPYVVVAGFKRIASAMQLGTKEIPSVILNVSEKEALLIAIHDNIHRGLNIIEKAHSIGKMFQTGFSLNEIEQTALLMSLNPHEKIIERMIALAGAENGFKDFVIAKNLSMKNIENFMRFAPDERARITDMLAPIHTTEGLLREVLELLSIVRVRQGGIDFNMFAGTTSADELRKRLKRLANPILSSLEEKLKELKLRCSLPPAIDIKVDPFFEKGYIDILIRAQTEEEIRDAIERFEKILDKGYMGSILELTKG